MNAIIHKKYFLYVDDDDFVYEKLSDVKTKFVESFKTSGGEISFDADDGPRPWWQRYLFGSKIYSRPYFAIKWSNGISRLIFYDVNGSEYRVLSQENLEIVNEDVRRKLAFSEYELLELKYCVSKVFALKAVEDLFSEGKIPQWIKYEFVK